MTFRNNEVKGGRAWREGRRKHVWYVSKSHPEGECLFKLRGGGERHSFLHGAMVPCHCELFVE
jgi:hypothetical protein